MKTYFDIIKDVSNLRWSIVDPDPSSFVEVQKAVKLAIAQANSYIWSLNDFPFRIKKDVRKVQKDQSALMAPKGDIIEVWLAGQNSYLKQTDVREADFFSLEEKGRPFCFWIEFGDNGAEIHLYPKPRQSCYLCIRYADNHKARSAQGNLKFNLEEMDDVLNLPEDKTIEDLYLHCLYTKSMEYLIADSSDENYQPYQKEFLEAYRNLLRLTALRIKPRIVF